MRHEDYEEEAKISQGRVRVQWFLTSAYGCFYDGRSMTV
jgi:hypothetical protein